MSPLESDQNSLRQLNALAQISSAFPRMQSPHSLKRQRHCSILEIVTLVLH